MGQSESYFQYVFTLVDSTSTCKEVKQEKDFSLRIVYGILIMVGSLCPFSNVQKQMTLILVDVDLLPDHLTKPMSCLSFVFVWSIPFIV